MVLVAANNFGNDWTDILTGVPLTYFDGNVRGVAQTDIDPNRTKEKFGPGQIAFGPPNVSFFPNADGVYQGGTIAVGQDGTLYAVSCMYSNPPENRLYAYSPELDELWHLDLGKNVYCPFGNGVLDDDGVLYFAIPSESNVGTDVVAIQTKSPGLARSAWPMIRHDNRGTMWLVSAPPSGSDHDGSPRDGAPAQDGYDVPLATAETDTL